MNLPSLNKGNNQEAVQNVYYNNIEKQNFDGYCEITYLLTPWSRVLLEKLTSKLCS